MLDYTFFTYHTAEADRPVRVERLGDSTRIAVPHQSRFDWRLYIMWGGFYLATWARWKLGGRPPRVEVVVDERRVRFTLRSFIDDTPKRLSVRRRPSLVLRANAFEPGLYIDAPGQRRETILEELPDSLIDRLVAELDAALERHPVAAEQL